MLARNFFLKLKKYYSWNSVWIKSKLWQLFDLSPNQLTIEQNYKKYILLIKPEKIQKSVLETRSKIRYFPTKIINNSTASTIIVLAVFLPVSDDILTVKEQWRTIEQIDTAKFKQYSSSYLWTEFLRFFKARIVYYLNFMVTITQMCATVSSSVLKDLWLCNF